MGCGMASSCDATMPTDLDGSLAIGKLLQVHIGGLAAESLADGVDQNWV